MEQASKDVFSKLIAIAGDVGEENLGISPEDRQRIIDNVNCVIHSAATLDFQANLKPTVTINLLGTRRVMELCQQIKNIKVCSNTRTFNYFSLKLINIFTCVFIVNGTCIECLRECLFIGNRRNHLSST